MIALGLLTASACCHAAWNLLVKKTSQTGPAFVWLCGLVTLPLSVALLIWSGLRGSLGSAWWSGLVSMLLHTTYAVTLQKAYGAGEFSTVYPVSRGVAPVLVTVAAIPWQGWPAAKAWGGVVLVVCGVLVMDGLRRYRRMALGLGLGLAVATCTAAYTLWDGFAMTSLGANLVPYLAIANVAQIVVLSTILAPRRGELRAVLGHWRQAIPIAILTPASYGLVLLALSFASVGTVAIGRTLNVVVGAVAGLVVLRERLSLTRIAGLTTVVAGVLIVTT
ncbi:EamA family transporter [Kribbella sp. NPDC050241]|uniref:EamA family transporter n=1 Tax=Kribbella sp. NPDC050241 TaxID=3364115 RepID=UPI0037A706A9